MSGTYIAIQIEGVGLDVQHIGDPDSHTRTVKRINPNLKYVYVSRRVALAAPDLLAACENMLQLCADIDADVLKKHKANGHGNHLRVSQIVVEAAKAAIAKALGGGQ